MLVTTALVFAFFGFLFCLSTTPVLGSPPLPPSHIHMFQHTLWYINFGFCIVVLFSFFLRLLLLSSLPLFDVIIYSIFFYASNRISHSLVSCSCFSILSFFFFFVFLLLFFSLAMPLASFVCFSNMVFWLLSNVLLLLLLFCCRCFIVVASKPLSRKQQWTIFIFLQRFVWFDEMDHGNELQSQMIWFFFFLFVRYSSENFHSIQSFRDAAHCGIQTVSFEHNADEYIKKHQGYNRNTLTKPFTFAENNAATNRVWIYKCLTFIFQLNIRFFEAFPQPFNYNTFGTLKP